MRRTVPNKIYSDILAIVREEVREMKLNTESPRNPMQLRALEQFSKITCTIDKALQNSQFKEELNKLDDKEWSSLKHDALRWWNEKQLGDS